MNRRFALVPLADAGARLAQNWRRRAAAAPLFLSWEWLEAQAATSGLAGAMRVLTDAGRPLAMLSARKVRRHGILPVRQWYLNETGDPAADRVALEFNSMLEPGVCEAAFGWLFRCLPGADELIVRNATGETAKAIAAATSGAGWGYRTTQTTAAPFVDLANLRLRDCPFEAGLGRSTRASIRRTARLYENAYGPLRLVRAENSAEALRFFERLEVLHTAQWASRGKAGAFADPRFRRFHRHFLARIYDCGKADLLRISAGDREVGYLYSLRSPGRWVMAYQSGLAPGLDNRWKPGYLSHALAVDFFASQGDARYDFLAGPVRYKQQLADGQTPLESIAAFAPRAKFVVENAMREAGSLARAQLMK